MRGHIRKRGESGGWEYIVDIGVAQAPSAAPTAIAASGSSAAPRRAAPPAAASCMRPRSAAAQIKGGFATQKECQAAMNKLLVAVEQQTYTAPTKATVQAVPDQGVAAGRQGHDPALDLQLLRAARRVPHRAAHRCGEAAEALRQSGQRSLRQARREREDGWQARPLAADHPSRPRLPAQGLQGRCALGPALAQPAGRRRSAARQGRRLARDEDLDARSNSRRSSRQSRTIASPPCGTRSP